MSTELALQDDLFQAILLDDEYEAGVVCRQIHPGFAYFLSALVAGRVEIAKIIWAAQPEPQEWVLRIPVKKLVQFGDLWLYQAWLRYGGRDQTEAWKAIVKFRRLDFLQNVPYSPLGVNLVGEVVRSGWVEALDVIYRQYRTLVTVPEEWVDLMAIAINSNMLVVAEWLRINGPSDLMERMRGYPFERNLMVSTVAYLRRFGVV